MRVAVNQPSCHSLRAMREKTSSFNSSFPEFLSFRLLPLLRLHSFHRLSEQVFSVSMILVQNLGLSLSADPPGSGLGLRNLQLSGFKLQHFSRLSSDL